MKLFWLRVKAVLTPFFKKTSIEFFKAFLEKHGYEVSKKEK